MLYKHAHEAVINIVEFGVDKMWNDIVVSQGKTSSYHPSERQRHSCDMPYGVDFEFDEYLNMYLAGHYMIIPVDHGQKLYRDDELLLDFTGNIDSSLN